MPGSRIKTQLLLPPRQHQHDARDHVAVALPRPVALPAKTRNWYSSMRSRVEALARTPPRSRAHGACVSVLLVNSATVSQQQAMRVASGEGDHPGVQPVRETQVGVQLRHQPHALPAHP